MRVCRDRGDAGAQKAEKKRATRALVEASERARTSHTVRRGPLFALRSIASGPPGRLDAARRR